MRARVLLINLQGLMGGAETSLCQLVRHLRAHYSLYVACPPDATLAASLDRLGIPVHPLPSPPQRSYMSPWSAGYWTRVSGRAVRAARRVRPQIIHGNTFHTAPVVAIASRLTGARPLVHARDYPNGCAAARVCGCARGQIVAVSDSVKQALVERGLPAERIHVIHNGVEIADPTDGNSPAESHRGRGGKTRPFVFANVGQFVEWKKQIDFLQAAALTAGDLPDARFLLVGDDVFERNRGYRRRVRRHAETCFVAERTTMLGWQDDMTRVWPRIDCLVHTAEREPFGRVLVEAMLHEIPVIAIDSGGPSEILEHGRTGLLMPPRDRHGLAAAMVRIARHPGYAATLAAQGRQAALSRFSASTTADRIRHIYEALLMESTNAYWAEPSCGRPEYFGR